MVLLFFTGGVNVNNAVLCFGENGHVEIEFRPCSENTIISEINPDTVETTKITKTLLDECVSCTDIPLFFDNISYLSKLNFSELSSIPETKFIFSVYYPKEPENNNQTYQKEKQNTLIQPNKQSYINTDTTVLLN